MVRQQGHCEGNFSFFLDGYTFFVELSSRIDEVCGSPCPRANITVVLSIVNNPK